MTLHRDSTRNKLGQAIFQWSLSTSWGLQGTSWDRPLFSGASLQVGDSGGASLQVGDSGGASLQVGDSGATLQGTSWDRPFFSGPLYKGSGHFSVDPGDTRSTSW